MRLATFNIYWLGHPEKGLRTAADRDLIAQVIARLDADVIAFQEIVDPAELQNILARAHGLMAPARDYRIHDEQNQLLGQGKNDAQKIVLAFDAQKYRLLAAAPIKGGIGRAPFGLRVSNHAGAEQVLVVGVHFQSGYPNFADAADAAKRRQQSQHLAEWVTGQHAAINPVLPQPLPGEHVVILGDFNALYDLEPHQPKEWQIVVNSLAPLRQAPLNDWWWEKPLADPRAPDDRTSSYVDQLLIDFVMLSPSLKERIVQLPTIYAFDHDPAITSAGSNNLARSVSDHRPVHLELNLASA